MRVKSINLLKGLDAWQRNSIRVEVCKLKFSGSEEESLREQGRVLAIWGFSEDEAEFPKGSDEGKSRLAGFRNVLEQSDRDYIKVYSPVFEKQWKKSLRKEYAEMRGVLAADGYVTDEEVAHFLADSVGERYRSMDVEAVLLDALVRFHRRDN